MVASGMGITVLPQLVPRDAQGGSASHLRFVPFSGPSAHALRGVGLAAQLYAL